MEYLQNFFKIQPNELKKVRWLIIYFFSVGFYCMIITTIAYSVFNIRFGARYLPYIFILFPFIYLICSYIYIRVLPKADKRIFFRYFILLVLLLHTLGFFILKEDFLTNTFYAILMLTVLFIEDNLLILSMITIQNVSDIESIKRMVPITTVSATIGAATAAMIINYTAHILNPVNFFLVFSFFIFIIAWSADVLLSKHRVISVESAGKIESGLLETLRYIKKNWFFILLILLVIVQFFIANINNFLYYVIVSDTLGDEAKMAAFMGLTGAVKYLSLLVFNLFIFVSLVLKIGSLKTVTIVLVSAIMSTTLMMFSENMIVLALVSNVIFFVLVIKLNVSLLHILFKSVDPRYVDSFIAVTNLFVIFSGYILAGLAALFFSYGQINIYMISGLSIAVTAFMLALWQLKQSSFVIALENTMNFSEELDFTKVFGRKGLMKYLPQMEQKILHGSSPEKAFTLELFHQIDFPRKEELLLKAFQNGDLAFKFKILDMIFERKISGRLFAGLTSSIEPSAQQYLIKNLFFNIKDMTDEGMIELIAHEKGAIQKQSLEPQAALMYEYMFEGKQDNYGEILAQLISSQKSDNYLAVLLIMKNFAGLEDDTNRRFLPKLMQHLKSSRSILQACVASCSLYDTDGMYLKNIFACHCDYTLMENVCTYYGSGTILNAFSESEFLIPQTYLLFAAAKAGRDTAVQYSWLCDEVKDKFSNLIKEKQKILKSVHPATDLLLNEVNRLIVPVSAVLTDYLFTCHGLTPINKLSQHLKDKKNMACEIIKNALPLKASDYILPLLNEEITISDNAYNFSALDTGNSGINPMNLYKYLGGELTDEKAGELDRIMVLRSVPLFAELDMDLLYQVFNVAKYKKAVAGEEVIIKGEISNLFYVIIEGKTGVYPEDGVDSNITLGPGEIFGELAVIDGGKRTATIKALEESLFLEFSGDDFIALLQSNSAITFYVIKTLSRRLRNMLETTAPAIKDNIPGSLCPPPLGDTPLSSGSESK